MVRCGSCSCYGGRWNWITDNITHILQHLAFGKMRQSNVRVLCNSCLLGTNTAGCNTFPSTLLLFVVLSWFFLFFISHAVCAKWDPDPASDYHLGSDSGGYPGCGWLTQLLGVCIYHLSETITWWSNGGGDKCAAYHWSTTIREISPHL